MQVLRKINTACWKILCGYIHRDYLYHEQLLITSTNSWKLFYTTNTSFTLFQDCATQTL